MTEQDVVRKKQTSDLFQLYNFICTMILFYFIWASCIKQSLSSERLNFVDVFFHHLICYFNNVIILNVIHSSYVLFTFFKLVKNYWSLCSKQNKEYYNKILRWNIMLIRVTQTLWERRSLVPKISLLSWGQDQPKYSYWHNVDV